MEGKPIDSPSSQNKFPDAVPSVVSKATNKPTGLRRLHATNYNTPLNIIVNSITY